MPKTIQQSATFPVSPDRLYRTYLNPREHAAACGWGRAGITAKVGGRMELRPHISGKFLLLVPGRLIVQTWRGADWKKSDADSVLVLALRRAGRGSRLEMTHANVPDAHARGIRGGWRSYYWKPWKAYLRRRGRRA